MEKKMTAELLEAIKPLLEAAAEAAVDKAVVERLKNDPRFWELVRQAAARGHLTFKDRSISK